MLRICPASGLGFHRCWLFFWNNKNDAAKPASTHLLLRCAGDSASYLTNSKACGRHRSYAGQVSCAPHLRDKGAKAQTSRPKSHSLQWWASPQSYSAAPSPTLGPRASVLSLERSDLTNVFVWGRRVGRSGVRLLATVWVLSVLHTCHSSLMFTSLFPVSSTGI